MSQINVVVLQRHQCDPTGELHIWPDDLRLCLCRYCLYEATQLGNSGLF